MYAALLTALGTLSARKEHRDSDHYASQSGEEEVWLLDNTASLDSSSTNDDIWTVEYKAKYYNTTSGSKLQYAATKTSMAFACGDHESAGGDKQAVEGTLAERIAPFFNGAIVNERCKVLVDADKHAGEGARQNETGEKKTYELGPSDAEGRSSNVIVLRGNRKSGEIMTTRVLEADMPSFECRTVFAKPEGWAVISDIDDTIKKTATDRRGLVEATTNPKPVDGMPEFYQFVTKQLNNPAYWYLSDSSDNFFPYLRAFRSFYYPFGSVILRNIGFTNLFGLLRQTHYKVQEMQKIHQAFPKRHVICVGDTAGKDPETYGEMYRRNPDWIKGIFIRRVKEKFLDFEFWTKNKSRNRDSRFTSAFKDVPQHVWHVFDDPKELYERVQDLHNE